MRFLFTCGGTAGHINPALGVAGKLRELMPESRFLFVGAEGMMETELVPRAGFNIETVKITNLSREKSLAGLRHNLATAKNLLGAGRGAKRIIRSFRPDAVIGTGGYVCYPVLSAARSLGIPAFLHESNAVPGLTTKLLAGKVDCVMVGFEDAVHNYKRGVKVVCTGTPVRTDFQRIPPEEAKRRLGLDPNKKLALSVWGSLGADHMNEIMAELIPLAVRDGRISLIHSAGKRGCGPLMKALEEKGCAGCGKSGADVREYIHDMPLVMAAADLVMCRAGASTLAELAALGKPAILVPSPNVTANHQEPNARLLENAGGAVVLLEGQFTAVSLYEKTLSLLADDARLEKMGGAMRSLSGGDSAAKIAELILERLG